MQILTPRQIQSSVNINTILGRLGKPQTVVNGKIPQEGSDFVAPLNSLPFTNDGYSLQDKGNISQNLPSTFDWRGVVDNKGLPVIRAAGVQYGAGICWLVGVISSLEDKITLASGIIGPYLSYTKVLSCGSTSGSCAGGDPYLGAQYISINGTVDYTCQDFSFCVFDSGCYTGDNTSIENNALIPSCIKGCSTCFGQRCSDISDIVSQRFFFIDPHSIQRKTTIPDIKSSCHSDGPIPATMQVYMDFILGGLDPNKAPSTQGNYWSATNGIYINIENKDLYNMGSLPSEEGISKLVSDTFVGNHTMVICGWGQQNISSFGNTPYWIVRNSWSTIWNAPEAGFCRVAMTDASKGINTRLGLDIPLFIPTLNISLGGAVTFKPTDETIRRMQLGVNPSDLPTGNIWNKHVVREIAPPRNDLTPWIIVIIIIVPILFILWIMKIF